MAYKNVKESHEDLLRKINESVNIVKDGTDITIFFDKNLSKSGVKPVKAEKKRKSILKTKFKTYIITLIIVATLAGKMGYDKVKLDNAIDYVSDSVESDVELVVSDGEFYNKVNNLIYDLKDKGLSEETSLFFIKETYGNEVFDKVVQSMGYTDGGDYMVDKGYESRFIKNSFNGVPSDNRYKKDMSNKIIDEVEEIKGSRKGF